MTSLSRSQGHVANGYCFDDCRYIKGTRLTVNGWFQACRGCNNPTARTAAIRGAAVPMCSRCSEKFVSMCVGEVPAGTKSMTACFAVSRT